MRYGCHWRIISRDDPFRIPQMRACQAGSFSRHRSFGCSRCLTRKWTSTSKPRRDRAWDGLQPRIKTWAVMTSRRSLFEARADSAWRIMDDHSLSSLRCQHVRLQSTCREQPPLAITGCHNVCPGVAERKQSRAVLSRRRHRSELPERMKPRIWGPACRSNPHGKIIGLCFSPLPWISAIEFTPCPFAKDGDVFEYQSGRYLDDLLAYSRPLTIVQLAEPISANIPKFPKSEGPSTNFLRSTAFLVANSNP
ncbi:hypothetical protein F4780DRAFT_387381 [Xylariomycetidae sp. FL0641]|nr:hypothetical protein F4780DRAFT_387381 [Xylariomycetidae sp. FL0641]